MHAMEFAHSPREENGGVTATAMFSMSRGGRMIIDDNDGTIGFAVLHRIRLSRVRQCIIFQGCMVATVRCMQTGIRAVNRNSI